MTERWLPAWGLASIAFGGASLIVPLYLVELGGGAFAIGVLFATGSFVGVPAALICGNLADKTGKRRVFVLSSMAISVVTLLVIPFLDKIGLVLVVNALLWFGFAASLPVLTLLVVAGEPEERWGTLIARLNKFQGVGWAAGLALGFVILTVFAGRSSPVAAQRWFFLACATSASLGLILAHRRLPPDPKIGQEPSPRRLRRRVREAAKFNIRGAAFPFTPSRFDPRDLHPRTFARRFTPPLGLYFTAVLTIFTGFGTFFAPLPAFLSDHGYQSSEIFGLYLMLTLGAALFFGRAAMLAGKYDVIPVHAGGLVARGISLPLVAVAGITIGGSALGLGALGLLFAVIGLSWAVIAVTATMLVTMLAPSAIRGEALGVYGALVAVGGGIGGMMGGWLAGWGYFFTFNIAAGFVVLGILVVGLLSRSRTVDEAAEPIVS